MEIPGRRASPQRQSRRDGIPVARDGNPGVFERRPTTATDHDAHTATNHGNQPRGVNMPSLRDSRIRGRTLEPGISIPGYKKGVPAGREKNVR